MTGIAIFVSGLFAGVFIGVFVGGLTLVASEADEQIVPMWRCGKCEGARVPLHSPHCPLRLQA